MPVLVSIEARKAKDFMGKVCTVCFTPPLYESIEVHHCDLEYARREAKC